MPEVVSPNTWPSTSMRQVLRGRNNPAAAPMMVDLPEPDGPNSTTTPGERQVEPHIHLDRDETVSQRDRQAHLPSAAFSRLASHSDNNSPISASVSETSEEFSGLRLAARHLQHALYIASGNVWV